MRNRFSKPSNSLSAVQIAAVNALGESPDRLADAATALRAANVASAN